MMRKDHMLHFIAGLGIWCIVYVFTFSPYFGLVAAVITGLGKEVYDYVSGKGVAEWSDIFWTVIGPVILTSVLYLIV